MIKALIIGKGVIGTELYRQLNDLEWDVRYIFTRDSVLDNKKNKIDSLEYYKKYKDIDVVFLAKSTGTGEKALEYIKFYTSENIPVVTCEKGALSNFYSELIFVKHKLGYSATVGGGTRMLKFIEDRVPARIQGINAIINGTLNYVFSELSDGKELGEVVNGAIAKGFVEPGNNSILGIINSEIKDVAMKAVIIGNMSSILSTPIVLKDIDITLLDDGSFGKLAMECARYRCIFSLTKAEPENVIGGFVLKIEDWFLSAGFRNINNLPQDLITTGEINSILLYEGDSQYMLKGPGAGAEPTALAMIGDARQLLGLL